MKIYKFKNSDVIYVLQPRPNQSDDLIAFTKRHNYSKYNREYSRADKEDIKGVSKEQLKRMILIGDTEKDWDLSIPAAGGWYATLTDNRFFIDWKIVCYRCWYAFLTILLVGIVIGILGIPYWQYLYGRWASACTEVYDGNEQIYKGNSYFYTTESRGTGTIFKQREEQFWFPRQIKEIQSNKISIKTVACESKGK